MAKPKLTVTQQPSQKTDALTLSREQVLVLKNIGLQKTLLDVQMQQNIQMLLNERQQLAVELCEQYQLECAPEALFDTYSANLETCELTLTPQPTEDSRQATA